MWEARQRNRLAGDGTGGMEPPAGERMGLSRREFLRVGGLAVGGGLLARQPVMAGPFDGEGWEGLVPADKRLHPDWVRALTARGERTVYTKARGEIGYIGMPVGGLCCGTMYLGGDGRLWLWDIFNQAREGVVPKTVDFLGRQIGSRDGAAYVEPNLPTSPLEQGFALRVTRDGNAVTRELRADEWQDISFIGEYPMGFVAYRDPAMPVQMDLEAFSPFVPLDEETSSLPATVMRFTITNTSSAPLVAELAGWLQNAACLYSGRSEDGVLVNRPVMEAGAVSLVGCSAEETAAPSPARPDIVFEDFERATYDRWETEGLAFGAGPVAAADVPDYQGDLGMRGNRAVNSHAAAPAGDVGARDAHTGRLVSPVFRIVRRYIRFLIGGGNHPGETCLNLLVGGEVVRSATGRDANRMQPGMFDVADLEGQSARLEIVDAASGGWGNIGVDHIVFSDLPERSVPLAERPDFGTVALAMPGGRGDDRVLTDAAPGGAMFDSPGDVEPATRPCGERLLGALVRRVKLAPGESAVIPFLVCWHFPNVRMGIPDDESGRHYAVRFADAAEVARHVAGGFEALYRLTRLWHDTWYDSTLPYWFLDRTMANTSTLATTTCHRFGTGRFYAWEGIGCCPGTCTHVWHYAQAVGRLFPALERDQRERVDFGLGFDAAEGRIQMRAEKDRGPAVDGQCGRILGVYREHRMSADDAFLRRLWPRVKQAIAYLHGYDQDQDGVMEQPQQNTLDASWFGQIPWITSLYLCVLRAGEEMAMEMGDDGFAADCRRRFESGRRHVETRLFNGEYFVQLPDPDRSEAMGTYEACHIDQVLGQGWAWQAGMGRILDREQTLSALRSLYRYNFCPDLTRFLSAYPKGRPYVMAGEGGLLMDSNPRNVRNVFRQEGWQGMYFYECMSGFEHQAAAHMIAEGLVQEGLTVIRAIHDRYHAARRNPWNEVECSDHYARAMASYGSYIALCGFDYHGPHSELAFAPRSASESFQAAFVAAEGWGTFRQEITDHEHLAEVTVRWGSLTLRSLTLELPLNHRIGASEARIDAREIPHDTRRPGHRARIEFADPISLAAGQTLHVRLNLADN